MQNFLPTWLLLLSSSSLFAQASLQVHQLSDERILFDGILDEEVYETIRPLPYIMFAPTHGKAPSEPLDVFVTYDKDYLYFSGKMGVSHPDFIRATTFKRDAFDGTTDYFGLVLDSFNDNENGLAFFTTPTGLRFDGVVFNDALTDAHVSLDWNTFWDAKSVITDSMWSAEIRIPWSSLRFQDKEGKVTMGISSWRYMPAKNEVDLFPAIKPDWGGMSTWKPSQMQKITFENVYSRKPLYIAPYMLAGFQQAFELNEMETAYEKKENPKLEAGLDVKYGITNNLTLDLTVNTDFAQVEVDDQQVNLTRFSLFFPEKRLFFQERASIFDFSFDDFNRLFYSRRIGINDDGDFVRLLGGARLVGRVGKSDIGVLNLQTAAFEELNSENFSLLRLRRQVLNPNSYIGGIFTNRMDFDGNYNAGFGLDGIFRVVGNDYLSVKWAQTLENGASEKFLSLNPSRLHLLWEKRQFEKFSYVLTYSRVGETYNPGMGFELRENVSRYNPKFQYGWTLPESSPILRIQAYQNNDLFVNNSSGIVETANTAAGFSFESKKSWIGNGAISYNYENLVEPFEFSDSITFPVKAYSFLQANGYVETPFNKLVGIGLGIGGGQFFDGTLATVEVKPRWKASAHFETDLYYQFARGTFPDLNQSFTSHLARWRALFMVNTKISVSAFIQYNSLEEVFLGNLRFRLNPSEGNDLFIVFNDVLNTHLERETPFLPRNREGVLLVKYTYTFNL